MTTLEVMFEIPKHIATGLSLGTMERVGGVIRDTSGKQVVAWLRDGIELDTTSQALQAVGATTQALSKLAGTGIVLNLALSGASLVATIQRLNQLSSEIENLHAEFDRDRDTNFQSALETAHDALKASRPETRGHLAMAAVDRLNEAKINFLKDFQDALTTNPQVAQHYLIRAMYAVISRIRCYLEIEDINLARESLDNDLGQFRIHAHKLVESWLGEHPAIFLHKDAEDIEVEQFIQIQKWLKQVDVLGTQDVIALIQELRRDFWNQDIMDSVFSDIADRIRGKRILRLNDRISESLAQAEIVIENYRHLEGFHDELRYLRLTGQSFNAWRHENEDKITDTGWGLFVFDEPVSLVAAS
jgi:hypothetical protein